MKIFVLLAFLNCFKASLRDVGLVKQAGIEVVQTEFTPVLDTAPRVPSFEEEEIALAVLASYKNDDGDMKMRSNSMYNYPQGDPVNHRTWGGCRAMNWVEVNVLNLINEKRADANLATLTVSQTLNRAAFYHTENNMRTSPVDVQDCVSLHSWLGASHETVPYESCCYDNDSYCMWFKPMELSGYYFTALSFEISQYSSWSYFEHGEDFIVNGWVKSDGHRALMLNEGAWAGYSWKHMGVSITQHFAHVWFTDHIDPFGTCSI
eukprot:GHVO01018484.1.p1 GENE.GHVO01018484.1~~GHVO01018484.1.p1  ORF type:complete len:275 (+),score=35.86 GHVO01018484.1:38-826(+)